MTLQKQSTSENTSIPTISNPELLAVPISWVHSQESLSFKQTQNDSLKTKRLTVTDSTSFGSSSTQFGGTLLSITSYPSLEEKMREYWATQKAERLIFRALWLRRHTPKVLEAMTLLLESSLASTISAIWQELPWKSMQCTNFLIQWQFRPPKHREKGSCFRSSRASSSNWQNSRTRRQSKFLIFGDQLFK